MEINLTGDSLFSSTNLARRLDPSITGFLDTGDVNFTNAEFAVPAPSDPVAAGRGYVTAVREDRLNELVDLKFNAVSFANNHSGDFGVSGIKHTIEAAQARGLAPLGLGNSLDEVHLPNFIDTDHERVGIVAATATRGNIFLASRGGNGVPPRAGVNPLRWQTSYQVTPEQFSFLKTLRDQLGLTKASDTGHTVERWAPDPDGEFDLGSLYETAIHIKKGSTTATVTTPNKDDVAELQREIRDAKYRSDFVIFSLHTHEGINEDWYADQPADFIVKTAHAAIDAGADVVVGHGAHFLRGVELYQGKVIFYNLGSFLMEFEAGESIIPPEMNEAYGHNEHSLPSVLHSQRAKENGEWVGFNANPVFNDGLMIKLLVDDGKVSFKALPLDLREQDQRVLNHGVPVPASEEITKRIFTRLNQVSEPFNTKLEFDQATGDLTITTAD